MGATAGTADLDLSAPPPQLEYKAAGASGVLLGHDDKKGIVECLVSVTGIKDDQGDIITPGAYAETLAKRKMKGVRHHDWARMAAKTLVQEEWLPGDSRLPKTLPDGSPWPKDAGALYIKGQYNLETKDGKEGYSNAKFYADEGQWSIGYRAVPGHVTRRKSDGARILAKIDSYEWSDVLHGANTQTSTLKVKSAAGGFGDALDEEPDGLEKKKFNPAQPRATDGEWTAGRAGSAASGSGDGSGLGSDWLKRVLRGDSSVVEGRGGGRGGSGGAGGDKKEQAAEQARRDKVEAAFDKERAAERKRRADADRTIEAATGDQKKELQAAERERRRQWQEAFDSARDAERKRRREWSAAQRKKKTAEEPYPDLDQDLDLAVDDDALTDEAGGEETAGDTGEKGGAAVTLKTKVRDVLPGSYEERRDALRDAARRALSGPTDQHGSPEWYVYVVGTWDDHVIVNRSPRNDGEAQTWQIPYTVGDDGTITFGEMLRVQLVAQVVPATKAGDTPAVSEATVTSVADLLEDATAQLSLAVTADAAGVKGAQIPADGAERLAGCVAQLLDTLAEAGVDVDSLGAPSGVGEVGGKAGKPGEEKTGEQAETGGMVLDLAQMQADLNALRID
ncbi:hypothetical protein ABZ671_18610 [Micromonospora sp. NPDC006766]|uniref:hypothetical protein n=1 Tax=Micromonospora sp. NPDC006766 TaxID=3154778 RepID=UPI0033D5EE32